MTLSPRILRQAAVAAAVILFILALIQFWPNDTDGEALASVEVHRGAIEARVTATGVLQPRTYVDVGAQVSGQLEALHVQVGDEVRQGDLLAEIDPTVYLARVDGTRAQLRNQQAQLKDREAQLTLAEIQLQRQKNLIAEDATTREALQSAEASLLSAEAQIEALSAQIDQTQSTLRAEEANLEYAKIYAPMNGTVVTIDARQGQTLNASQTTPLLMRIADLDTMSVQAQVSEADIGRLDLSAGFSLATAELFSMSDARESGNAGLSLSHLVFDGGRTRAQSRQAQARRQELLAQYRQTLLVALQETDDALGRVTLEAGQEKSDQEILKEAERALRLTDVRYREGSDDLLTLIDAQRNLFQAREQLAERRLSRLSAAVTLYQALGGYR